jgi:hypothetical protein
MSRYRTRVLPLVVAGAAVLLLMTGSAHAQILEDVVIVDSPTAGVPPHGGYLLHGSLGPQSSILVGVDIGFFDRAMLGASFGFQGFIGRGDIEPNDKPGFEVRLRVIEESESGPAFAVGVDTQGEETYFGDEERYERKSKGLYAVLSKNYRLIEDFSIHGGANYSFERKDEEGVNAFGGFSLELIRGFSILGDYNAALDDNDQDVPTHRTRGRGYLDGGLRFDYRDNLRFKILFKDILNNYIPESGIFRSVEVFYINSF